MSQQETLTGVDKLPATLNEAKRQIQAAKALLREELEPNAELKKMIDLLSRHISDAERQSRGLMKQFTLLSEVVERTAAISSSLELDQVLERVMDTVIQLTQANRAYLMLKDKATDELTPRIARNWDQQSLQEEEVLFSQSVIQATIRQGKPVYTTNAQDDSRFEASGSIIRYDLLAILCIPMLLHGRLVGVIYADNPVQQWSFDEAMLSLLSPFASQAAIAIENARSFEQVIDEFAQVQLEVQSLRIQMNRDKVDEQVKEISETSYFRRLTEMKDQLRNRLKRGET